MLLYKHSKRVSGYRGRLICTALLGEPDGAVGGDAKGLEEGG